MCYRNRPVLQVSLGEHSGPLKGWGDGMKCWGPRKYSLSSWVFLRGLWFCRNYSGNCIALNSDGLGLSGQPWGLLVLQGLSLRRRSVVRMWWSNAYPILDCIWKKIVCDCIRLNLFLMGYMQGWKKTRVFYKKKTNPLGSFNKTRVLLFFLGFMGIFGFSKRKRIEKFNMEIWWWYSCYNVSIWWQ